MVEEVRGREYAPSERRRRVGGRPFIGCVLAAQNARSGPDIVANRAVVDRFRRDWCALLVFFSHLLDSQNKLNYIYIFIYIYAYIRDMSGKGDPGCHLAGYPEVGTSPEAGGSGRSSSR